MTKLTVLVLLSSCLVYANARHIHPHGDSNTRSQDEEELWLKGAEKAEKSAPVGEEYVIVEVPEQVPRNIKPNRFVPLNNAIFFMGHQPCPEEGFKRDYMGVCREVWD